MFTFLLLKIPYLIPLMYASPSSSPIFLPFLTPFFSTFLFLFRSHPRFFYFHASSFYYPPHRRDRNQLEGQKRDLFLFTSPQQRSWDWALGSLAAVSCSDRRDALVFERHWATCSPLSVGFQLTLWRSLWVTSEGTEKWAHVWEVEEKNTHSGLWNITSSVDWAYLGLLVFLQHQPFLFGGGFDDG